MELTIGETSLLQELTFSAHFLQDILMVHLHFAASFIDVTSLTIYGSATPSRNIISLTIFLLVLYIFPKIRMLTVEDIHFDGDIPDLNTLPLRPANLCLRRVTGRKALLGILAYSQAEASATRNITIIDCSVHDFREPDRDFDPHFTAAHLTLSSMDSSATLEDIVCRWNGERLSVIGCPKLSRTFMEGLYGEAAPVRLSCLSIVDCDSFNAGDVIALVQSRENEAAFTPLMGVSEDHDSFMALRELCVRGRGPPISIKRATWLAEHVESFSWGTVARDGMRYVWDGSVRRLMVLPAGGS